MQNHSDVQTYNITILDHIKKEKRKKKKTKFFFNTSIIYNRRLRKCIDRADLEAEKKVPPTQLYDVLVI